MANWPFIQRRTGQKKKTHPHTDRHTQLTLDGIMHLCAHNYFCLHGNLESPKNELLTCFWASPVAVLSPKCEDGYVSAARGTLSSQFLHENSKYVFIHFSVMIYNRIVGGFIIIQGINESHTSHLFPLSPLSPLSHLFPMSHRPGIKLETQTAISAISAAQF